MKKLISLLSIVAIAAVMTIGASAKKTAATETAVFTVAPQMTCQNCENKIKGNLRFEKGITAIATDLKQQTVTVTFNPDKINKSGIVAALKKIGYEAKEGTCAAPAKTCVKHEGCKKAEGCCKKTEGCNKKAEGCCKK